MRTSIAVVMANLSGFAVAQDATVTLFMNDQGQYGYEASIVSAYTSETVYAMRCTAASSGAWYSDDCSSDAEHFTVTEGPATYALSSSRRVLVDGTTVTAGYTETCVFRGSIAANCSGELSGSSKSQTVAATTSTVVLNSDIFQVQVPVTAGATKTNTPISGTPSAGAAAPTNVNGVVAVGVAGIAGLAGLLAL